MNYFNNLILYLLRLNLKKAKQSIPYQKFLFKTNGTKNNER